METIVTVSIIKVYQVPVKHKRGEDPVSMVWDMEVEEIEKRGKMVNCETDYVEET